MAEAFLLDEKALLNRLAAGDENAFVTLFNTYQDYIFKVVSISAGFTYSTFIQPPFYFQNLVGQLGPQPKQDGTTGWTFPIDPTKKAIHMSDINDGKPALKYFTWTRNLFLPFPANSLIDKI